MGLHGGSCLYTRRHSLTLLQTKMSARYRVVLRNINPYAGGGLSDQYKIMQKKQKMTETLVLAYGYSSESTMWELLNEYQDDRVKMAYKNCLRRCLMDQSSLSTGRIKIPCSDWRASFIMNHIYQAVFDAFIVYFHALVMTYMVVIFLIWSCFGQKSLGTTRGF